MFEQHLNGNAQSANGARKIQSNSSAFANFRNSRGRAGSLSEQFLI